jgi:hypothetical protein
MKLRQTTLDQLAALPPDRREAVMEAVARALAARLSRTRRPVGIDGSADGPEEPPPGDAPAGPTDESKK